MTGQEYLQEHTINEASIKKFGLDPQEDKVLIPIRDIDGGVAYTKTRNLGEGQSKFYIPPGVKSILFNSEVLNKPIGYIIITAGEIDCIRLDQEGLHAVSSSAGESTFKEEWVKQLKGIKNIFLSLDNDEAGEKATQSILNKFPHAKVIKFPTAVKDVCEFFKFHTYNDYVKLMEEAQRVEPETPAIKEEDNFKLLPASELLNREFEDQNWIVDRFITVGGITIIVGESGSGKSYVALALIKAIIKKELLFDTFQAQTPTNILVIDKENGLRRTKKRMQAMGVPFSDNLFFLEFPEKFSLDNQKGLDLIADFIKTTQIGLIIVDSLIDVIIGNENSSVDVSQVFNALRSIGPNSSYLIIHHDSKPIPHMQRTAGQRTRGSSNIIAQVDNQFYLEKQKDPKKLYIEQGKSRDFEPVKKFELEFQSNSQGEMSGFKYIGEVQSELSKMDQAADFIMSWLPSNTDSTRQSIIDAAMQQDISEGSIKRAMSMLKDKKLLQSKNDPNNGRRKLFFVVSEMDVEEEEEEISQNRFIEDL